MSRVSAKHAAAIANVTPTTIHRWVRIGNLPRHSDGYEVEDVLKACDKRDLEALLIRAGKSSADRAKILRHVQRNKRVA